MQNKGLWIALAVVAIAVVGYFGFYYPPESSTEMAGTLGGVEKADRHRGDVTSEEDIVLAEDAVNDLLLSAEWQNLRRNEEFMAALESGAFHQHMIATKAVSDLTAYSLMTQGIVFQAIMAQDIGPNELKQIDTEKFLANSDLVALSGGQFLIPIKAVLHSLANNLEQAWHSQNPGQAMPNGWNDEMNKVILSQGMQLKLAQDFMQLMHAVDWKVILSQSGQTEHALLNTDFSKAVFNVHGLAGLLSVMSEESLPAWSQLLAAGQYQAYQNLEQFKGVLHWKGLDIQKIGSTDMQKGFFSQEQLSSYHAYVYNNCLMNEDFQKVFFSQDMQKWFSQDFQKLGARAGDSQSMKGSFWSQDFQKWGALAGDSQGSLLFSQEMMGTIWSQDFQKVLLSQDVQQLFMSQEFNALLASPNFNAVVFSAEFNNVLMAGDMQHSSTGTF